MGVTPEMPGEKTELPAMAEIPFVGGRLCLDFANTANWVGGRAVDERLDGFEAALTWAERQGLIAGEGAARLRRQAAKRPDQAALMARELRRFRLVLRRLLLSTPVQHGDLKALNRVLGKPGVALKAMGTQLALNAVFDDLAWLTLPLGFSALELLTSDRVRRVKACPGPRCGWLFLDQSPSGRRRWCSMATCGNREKAERFRRARKR